MEVEQHAINQFRTRSGCKKSDDYIREKLLEMADRGVEAEFRHPKYAVMALLNHHFQHANYLMDSGWVLVIVDEKIKTIHMNEAKRWQPTF
jgi:hypothetical protein